MKFSDWLRTSGQEIKIVCAKDLTEVLRDYRTLIVMILMPVVIYPALFALPSQVTQHVKVSLKEKKFSVSILGDSSLVVPFFKESNYLTISKISEEGNPDKMLEMKEADVVVLFPQGFSKIVTDQFELTPKVTIYYDIRREQNIMAVGQVRAVLNKFRRDCVEKRFQALSVKPPQEYDLTFTEVKPKGIKSLASEPVRNFLPFLLFSMLAIACVYPALDVVTGERERNTLPLLLIAPTDRINIMFGKFLVVCVIGVAAMVIGLISLYACVNYLSVKGADSFSFSARALLMCMFVCLPLIVTFSSLSIMLASLCRSFQQGQGYFVPFLIFLMSATGVCSLPDLKLSSGIAFVPIVNLALALKEVLSGHIEPLWLGITFFVSTAFACYVTYLASHVLDSERLLFGVFESRVRRRSEGDYLPELTGFTFVLFMLMFYVGQSLQSWDIVYGTLLTQLLVIVLPALLLLRYLKLPIASTLSLKPPHWTQVLGAILIAPSCVLASMLVYNLQCSIVRAPEAFNTMFTRLLLDNGKPLWLLLIAIAIAPGICEELLFRGTILGLLRMKLKVVPCCLVIGLLFGLFHLSIFRFLPTAALGMILTAICLFTGSIVPSMIVHTIHNALVVLSSKLGLESSMINCWPAELLFGLIGLIILRKGCRLRSNKRRRGNG